METKNIGILLLAGHSTRMNGVTKQFYVSPYEDKPLYIHPLETLNEALDDVVLVVGKGEKEKIEAQSYIYLKRFFPIVEGGETRTQSVFNGLNYIEKIYGEKGINVLIHDAARPFLPLELVRQIVSSLGYSDAITPTLKMTDSLLKDDKGKISYVPREDIYRVQTPQAFQLKLIMKAYEGLQGESKSDDFQLVLPLAKSPYLIPGSALNFKITTPDDLYLYDSIIKARLGKK